MLILSLGPPYVTVAGMARVESVHCFYERPKGCENGPQPMQMHRLAAGSSSIWSTLKATKVESFQQFANFSTLAENIFYFVFAFKVLYNVV